MNIFEMKQRLLSLTQRFKEVLPSSRFHFIETNITYGGECELSLEILCENLRDMNYVPDLEALEEIKTLGELLQVAPSYWECWNKK